MIPEKYVWIDPELLKTIKKALTDDGVIRLEAPCQEPIKIYKNGVEFIHHNIK